MRIALLTTQTLHHSWYLLELQKHFPSVLAILETTAVMAPFATHHPFEDERDAYEKETFFSGQYPQIRDITESFETENINHSSVLDFTACHKTDLLICFGTRKITSDLLTHYAGRIINLHGGDPEYYRGLDSHLWAIYHNDWSNLVTTLHMLNETLDDGAVIQQQSLELSVTSSLAQLRRLNTQACLHLSLMALKTYQSLGFFMTRPQTQKGRYYSFMPQDLKEICVQKFNRHIDRFKQL